MSQTSSNIRTIQSVDEISNESSSILVRTSKFFKKVSNIRPRNKQSVDIHDSTHEAAVFAARSLALGRKSFGFSQPVLGVHARETHRRRMPSDVEEDSDASPRSSNLHGSSPIRPMSSSPQTRQNADRAGGTTAQPTSAVSTPPHKSASSPSALPNNTRHRSNSSWSRLFGDKDKPKPPGKEPVPCQSTSPRSAPAAPVTGLPRSPFSTSLQIATQPDGLPRCSEPALSPSPILRNPHLSLAVPVSQNSATTPASHNVKSDVSPSPGHAQSILNTEFETNQALISKTYVSAESPQPAPHVRASLVSIETRSQSLPSRHAVSPIISTPPPPPSKPANSAPMDASTPEPELQRQKSLHIRLASLPPPMMARYTAEGSARLTPSVVPRPTPMPLLNLPTLRVPTPRPVDGDERAGRSRGAPLRSMPALPLTGPRDDEDPEAEEEGSDSSDDGEEEGTGARDEDGSDDEHADGDQTASASTSRFELPRVMTSPFALSFGSKVAGPPVRAYERHSPVAGPSSQPLDYFSVPKQEQSDQETLRTPRPGDYATTPSKLTEIPSRPDVDLPSPEKPKESGPGIVPEIIPIPPTPTSPAVRRPPRITRPSTGPGEASTSLQPRPSLCHHGSKSMVDLSLHSRYEEKSPERTLEPIVDGESMRQTTELHPSIPAAHTLKRQRSLPTYNPDSEPPPYPAFFPGHRPPFLIQPREEEGREPLPSYSNSIFLMGMMPRKMEFTAPGVQAKERKWRRVIVVLEGTVLRLYRTHGAGIAGKGGKVGEWWERTVGAGDWSTTDGVGGVTGSQGGVRVSAIRDRERRIQLQSQGNAPPPHSKGENAEHSEQEQQQIGKHAISPLKSRFHLPSSLLHPGRSRDSSFEGTPNASRHSLAVPPGNGSTRSRLSFEIPRERVEETLTAGRRSMDALRTPPSSRTSSSRNLAEPSTSPTTRSPVSARSRSSSNLDPSSSSTTSRSSHSTSQNKRTSMGTSDPNGSAMPDAKDLIRSYTLQHAESGLASDYLKRKNVIRVRMEGEQFLLQARDVAGVIDWIEAIQAATNIALDLDERPMPKGPLFPRRRRRRQRHPEANGPDGGASQVPNNTTPP